MKTAIAWVAFLMAVLSAAQEPLTNETILKLVKAGIGEETIVAMINQQPGKYALGADDLIALKKGGVSDKVLAAMIVRNSAAMMPSTQPPQTIPPGTGASAQTSELWVTAQAPASPQKPLPRPASDDSCTAYFGVIQEDDGAPGGYVARMSSPQASWYSKNRGRYPGVCLSLEKAQYIILWTVSTETRTIHTTETRTANETASTTGHETGTFRVYGSLSAWGTYSGNSSSFSNTTNTYKESVPVTIAADHCSNYVLKSVGPTVWDDIRNKTPQPFAIFSVKTRGANKVKEPGSSLGTNAGLLLGSAISHAVRREPTAHALDAALKFIATQYEEPNPVTQVPSQAPSPTAAASVNGLVNVTLTSNPPGALVSFSRMAVCYTPCVIKLEARTHKVTMKLTGYAEWNGEITVEAGKPSTLAAELERQTEP
jgi:hypothetical protein